ncbi:MAG: SMC-Scp complex subunit ScpB [Sphingobacteriales bacterium]|nr:MAG: SMC-Scp complex subunit ScpB [Sphingobacteriales bacterium]
MNDSELSVPTGQELQLSVEALLFAADHPLTVEEISGCLAVTEIESRVLVPEHLRLLLAAITEKYEAEAFPFQVVESGGGFRFLTKPTYHKVVVQLTGDKHLKKLSAAAMETLSIVAYRGPVTKGEIEFIRGVSADYAIQKLLDKELITISGRKEDAIGKPLLYMPSRHLLDYLGINGTHELPQLKDMGTIEYVAPTPASEAVPDDLQSGVNG